MKDFIVKNVDDTMEIGGIIQELIRCKDCRYNTDCVCVWHSGNDYTWIVVDDDYCSCAERKENE